jgi:hypothetical protein
MKGSPPGSRRVVQAAFVVLGALLACGVPLLRAATSVENLLVWPEGVRVFRVLDRYGNPRVVITNLDDAGNPLPGASAQAPGVPPDPQACRPADSEARDTGHARAGGAGEAAEDSGGGTTIVININNAPPAPPAPASLPVYALPVAYGGLIGPFRYPENHHFLGYGPGVGSPSLFGGLGLNSGNGFGLKTGVPCGAGFDCMFGPQPSRP